MGSALGEQPQEQQGFLHGKLLIAMPGMTDPRFEQSVIFMLNHSEAGAMGLIVNKPIPQLTYRELMQKMDVEVGAATPDRAVKFGGPCETDRGWVLHDKEANNRQSTIGVTPDILLTPTVDMLRAIAEGRGPARWLLARGYAGWGPGQIESEIAANGWLHCDADPQLVFEAPDEDKWRLAFGKLGAGLSGLSSEAGRA